MKVKLITSTGKSIEYERIDMVEIDNTVSISNSGTGTVTVFNVNLE